jgi:hypothetical protein
MIEIVLVVALFGQTPRATAPEPPPKIAKLLELCETSRRGAILQIEHKLRGLRQHGKASAATESTTTADSNRQIADLERQLKFLETTPLPVIPTISFPPQVGTIGRLPGESCHVDQIVSAREMLVRCFFQVQVVTVHNFKGQRENVEESVPCVIRGLDTSRSREGTDFETDGLYEVLGTEVYQTAGGKSRQLVILRPFDRKSLEKYLPATTIR